MKIGFDAKRAFFNSSGLGNYSRSLLNSLMEFYPDDDYTLFSPKENTRYQLKANNAQLVFPQSFLEKKFRSVWRSKWMTSEVDYKKLDIFHGLSHEIPYDGKGSSVKTVVSIHDLIFMRFPQFYKYLDRQIYKRKIERAVKVADKIVAISKQTKDDLINYVGAPEEKIEVVYQTCSDIYWGGICEQDKLDLRVKFNLPKEFLLSVGTIEERKNLFNVVKALHLGGVDFPLVVVGKKTDYYNEIKSYVESYGLSNIIFLPFVEDKELPVLYQMSTGFVYTSVFEGFGIPVLEALVSGVPVITSQLSCLPEAGGSSSLYVDPYSVEDIAAKIELLLNSRELREEMVVKGKIHAQRFAKKNVTDDMYALYKGLVR